MYASMHLPRRAAMPAGARAAAGARGSTSHAAVLELQRRAGNAAVSRLLADTPAAPVIQRQDREPRTAEVTGAKPAEARTFLASGPPPSLTDKEEATYRTEGEAKLAELGGAASTSAAGHTTVGPIEGFPEWFANLQSALVQSTEWRPDKEEKAQNVLANYALQRFALRHGGDQSKIPPTVRIFLTHVGRSTSNVTAAMSAKLPSSADLGGGVNAKNWCAQAGSSSVKLALQAVGLMPKGKEGANDEQAWNDWLTAPRGVPKEYMAAASVDAKIEIGDQVSYVQNGINAIGGHTVTALSQAQGEDSIFEHASGNAGGGASGSVRLGSSLPRARMPASLTWDDIAKKPVADLKVPAGKIYAYIVVKYSKFWADLAAIDLKAPNVWQEKPGSDFLQTYKLKPAPVKA